jgi:hypothetical protein
MVQNFRVDIDFARPDKCLCIFVDLETFEITDVIKCFENSAVRLVFGKIYDALFSVFESQLYF